MTEVLTLNVGTVAVAVVTMLLIQGAKKLHGFPLHAGQTKVLRLVAAVLTFGGTFAMATADGQLGSAEFQTYLGTASEGLVSYFMAYLGYKTILKGGKEKVSEAELAD